MIQRRATLEFTLDTIPLDMWPSPPDQPSGESGSCITENSYLYMIAGVKTGSDSGSGVEALLSFVRSVGDEGAGVETIIDRILSAFELPTGAIDKSALSVVHTDSDSADGVDTASMSIYFLKADAGAGADSAALQALFALTDSGSGVDASALAVGLALTEAGVGLDSVLAFLRLVAESGLGYDNCSLLGILGRVLIVAVYTRPYRDLKVYTRPYRDLKVMTREAARW